MKISELPKLGSIIESQDGASFPDITDTHVIVSTTPHRIAVQQSEISSNDKLNTGTRSLEGDGSNTLKASGPSSTPSFESGIFGTYSVPFLDLFANIIIAMAQSYKNVETFENWGIGFDTSDQTLTALMASFHDLVYDIAYNAADQCITDALNNGQLTSSNSTFVNTVQTIVNNMNTTAE